ncbi:MAG: transglycosylase SLT domain-containing protein [Gemmatimonadota bacterium]
MLRLPPTIAVLLLATGCASRAPEPATAPAPAPAPMPASISRSVFAADSVPRDSTPTPVVSDSEVVQRAAGIFAAPAAATEAGGPTDGEARATWDIDVRSYETHDMVAQYIGIFTGRARDYMERSMSRGTRYDAMLRRKFRASGLPEDMTYLALIESSYMPHAYSRAAAVGMWQFMAPTARGIGMRVDWWVDERRDPMRATEGAIDFLTDLHDAYGSWYLAAAAYNGGPGRVSRGLKRFSEAMDGSEGEDRFFALAEQRYLPSETKAYVPKLIAAAMVAKEPARYGLRVDTLPVFEYDSVTVPAGTPLAAVAKAAGVPLEDVSELNPHFLRGATPPDAPSEVRVPVGKAAEFTTAFAALSSEERAAWTERRQENTRSALAIADDAGISVKALRWVNPKLSLDRRGRVRAGTMLRIPSAMTIAGARDVPDPSIARYGSSSGALVAKRVRVRSGETLASVARRSGVSVAQLRSLNRIKGSRVRAGQVLVVRRPSRSAVLAARRSAARNRSSASAGQRCTSRVVKVKGKRKTVRSCAPAPRSASARASTRAGKAKASARSTRRTASSRRPATSSRRTAPVKQAKPKKTASR